MSIFWTDQGRQDPKRNYRFKLTITGIPGDALVWYAKKVTKPKFSITESVHTYLNHRFYYPGRVEWQEVTATLVDPVSPNVVLLMMQKLQDAGYGIPQNTSDLSTISKATAVNQILGVTIDQIDSVGNSVEHWELKNAWIKDFTMSDLDYESDDLSTMDIVFRYDWAECNGIFSSRGRLGGAGSLASVAPGGPGKYGV